jgi:hypothetical protein
MFAEYLYEMLQQNTAKLANYFLDININIILP